MATAPTLSLPIKSLADGSALSELPRGESKVSMMSSDGGTATATPSHRSAAGSIVESEWAAGEYSPEGLNIETPCVLFAATPSHLDDSFFGSGHRIIFEECFQGIEPAQDSMPRPKPPSLSPAVDSRFGTPQLCVGPGRCPWMIEMMQNVASPAQMAEVCPLQQTYIPAQLFDGMIPPTSAPVPPMWFFDQADFNAQPYCVALELDSLMPKPMDTLNNLPTPNTSSCMASLQASHCVPDGCPLCQARTPLIGSGGSDQAAVPAQELPQANQEKTDVESEALPSKGSKLHAEGKCSPCAWFWKARGCQNGAECGYCHMCPKEELKTRKKAKINAIRALILDESN